MPLPVAPALVFPPYHERATVKRACPSDWQQLARPYVLLMVRKGLIGTVGNRERQATRVVRLGIPQ